MLPERVSFKKLSDKLYVVQEKVGRPHFNTFVVLGEDKTVVIDSGFGIYGNIRKYIETNITDKAPMVCYQTHGDLDHIGGSALFDKAYLNSGDYAELPENMSLDRLYADTAKLTGGDEYTLNYAREHHISKEGLTFEELPDGTIIDLGGNKLEVYLIPGHTDGSVAFYNREENYLLTGDSITQEAGCRGGDEGMRRCVHYLERLRKAIPVDAVRYGSHDDEMAPLSDIRGQTPLTGELIDELIAGFAEILAGKTQNDKEFIRTAGPGTVRPGKTFIHNHASVKIRYTEL